MAEYDIPAAARDSLPRKLSTHADVISLSLRWFPPLPPKLLHLPSSALHRRHIHSFIPFRTSTAPSAIPRAPDQLLHRRQVLVRNLRALFRSDLLADRGPRDNKNNLNAFAIDFWMLCVAKCLERLSALEPIALIEGESICETS